MLATRRSTRLALALGLACTAALTARAARAQPACGAGFLGLEEGVSWRYERKVPEEGEQPESDKPGGLALELPTEVVLTVDAVTSDDGATVVELAETYGDIEKATEIRCGDDGLVVSPHSFLATGEPGGGIGVTLEESDREGTSYPRALRPGARWTEWIEAEFEMASATGSGAEHAAGKIQVERELRAAGRRVRLEIGETRYRPYRIDFTLSGRAMVEPEIELGVEIPADAAGALWFEPGVGLVRAVNRFGQDWKLAERGTGDLSDGDGGGDGDGEDA